MKRSKMTLFLLMIVSTAVLALSGCSGGSGEAVTPKSTGYALDITGNVENPKTSSKSVSLAVATNTVSVFDASTGLQLGASVPIVNGRFSGLTYNLTSTKTTIVYVADVTGGPLRYILPIDLSNPPAGLLSNNPVSITINQDSTAVVKAVEAELGLTGYLGDGVTKFPTTFRSSPFTFTEASTLVLNYGGMILAYTTNGIKLIGTVGNASLLPAQDASTFTFNDMNDIVLDAKIVSAFIPSKNPIVNFQVTNKATGKGISGLRTFGLHVAKLMPEVNGSTSYWVNYIDKGIAVPVGSGANATAATKPSADPGTSINADPTKSVKGYSVIDHGDGTYTAIFASDVTSNTNADGIHNYDASLVHRIGLTVTSVAVPGVTATGPINPVTGAVYTSFNVVNRLALAYDFYPNTGTATTSLARDIVTNDGCIECHNSIATIPNPDPTRLGALLGHTARPNVKLCVMCHTSTNTSGEGEFVTFIHRIHMGEVFKETNASWTLPAAGLVVYGEHTYPQDIRNCTKCHKNGVDSANWKTKANKKNCGSCHNALNFATHQGGQATDQYCNGCHAGASAIKEVAASHILKDVTTHNQTIPAGLSTITYAISGATLNASRNPAITFTIKKDGANVTLDATPSTRRLPLGSQGFSGGPTIGVYFGVPQDGITTPADFNASSTASLVNLWNSVGGTLVKNADGSYTATITSAVVPASAKVITATIYGTFNQAVPFYAYSTGRESATVHPFVTRYAVAQTRAVDGSTARRAIVDNAKCNKCHEQLGIKPSFHGGARNNGTMCGFCHTPNRTSNGWSASAGTFVHGVHAAAKRSNKYMWAAVSATDNYSKITYSGYLRNCEQCHVAGGYDFSVTTNTSSLLYDSVATGTISATSNTFRNSPYVTAGNNYGTAFSYTAATQVTVQAGSSTLVSSPIAAACFSCHDTATAVSHMKTNGGVLYAPRSAAFVNASTASGRAYNGPATLEQCTVCHGPAANTFNSTVPAIKAVHRWW